MVMKELNIIRCLFGEVERLILIVVASEFVDSNEIVFTYTSCQVLPVLRSTPRLRRSVSRGHLGLYIGLKQCGTSSY